MRKPAEAERVVATAVEQFGRLDVLVNNAGGSPSVPAADVSPRFVEAIIGLNLLAPFWCAQSAHKVMARPGGGRVHRQRGQRVGPAPVAGRVRLRRGQGRA